MKVEQTEMITTQVQEHETMEYKERRETMKKYNRDYPFSFLVKYELHEVLNNDNRREIWAWCNENIDDYKYIDEMEYLYRFFWFKNETDAMAFKLRWV